MTTDTEQPKEDRVFAEVNTSHADRLLQVADEGTEHDGWGAEVAKECAAYIRELEDTIMRLRHPDQAKRPKGLCCAVCGCPSKGRQWWNRDTGYGVCRKCYLEEVERNGEEYARQCYGYPGVHHSLGDEG